MEETVHLVTNRNLLSEKEAKVRFGDTYNRLGPHQLRYGEARVRVPPEAKRRFGDGHARVAASVFPEHLPHAEEGPKARALLGSSGWLEMLRQKALRNRADLLVLIHGFASDFDTALGRAAQRKMLYATPARPLEVTVFSWPSDGRAFGLKLREGLKLQYFDGRTDAAGSATAIARAFYRRTGFVRGLDEGQACGRSVHRLAHSMGNDALRHALQQMIRDAPRGRLPRLFENIFLMAADEDDDGLNDEAKLARLPEIAAAAHVYMARNDQALVISDSTKGNPDRLGAAGPRTLSDLPRKVTLIDCEAVSDTEGLDAHLRHQYHRTPPRSGGRCAGGAGRAAAR